MKKLCALCLLLVSLALVVAGCGGGGVRSTAATSTGGDQIIFNNGRTGVVSETARMSDASTVTTVVTANPSVSASKMAQLVVAKMQTMADFRMGGISTSGDPWGEFIDGSIYAVDVSDPDFLALSPKAPPATKTINKPTPSRVVVRPTTTTATTFPGSTKAYIIHGVEAARTSPSDQLRADLTQAGYTVSETNGGIADWSNLSGAGILVNDGHGTNIQGKFYVSTTDVETPALDKQYAKYIASKAIIIAGLTVYDSEEKKHTEQRYLLSIDYLKSLPNFATMFSPNSFFMDVVCCGDSKEAANFWGLLQTSAGLGDYSGWSQPVDEDAATQTADFFFDRMLGLNQATPVDPTLPPPATVTATAALLTTTARGSGSSTTMNKDGANLFSFHFGGNLNYMIPSIASVTPNSDGSKWAVQGSFGNDAGTATYGGVPVTPLNWTDAEIDIPAQTTTSALVVKTPTGLISNSFMSQGKPTLSPLASVIQQGGKQVLKVTVAGGLKGATYSYKWTNTANFGSISDGSGHTGATFTSSVGSVTYTPTPNLYGTDTITEQTFLVQTDGTMVSIGKGTATVQVDISGVFSITPASANIDQTQKQPILVSVQGGAAGATYTYKWANTANFGTIADAKGNTGPSFTSSLAAVTYTPKGTAGSDTVTVEVFVVAADKTQHSLGTQECEISVAVHTLNFTPADGLVAISQTQVFSVAPLTGSFPNGATFVWVLTGQGSINGSQNVTTKVPQVTYKAPSHTVAGDLEVTVKDSTGKTIGNGDQTIIVQAVVISPSSVTLAGPGAGTSFNVKGTFPAGTTFKWSCKTGGLSTTGTQAPFPNTLTTTTASVSYLVANPPPDGSPATDTVTINVFGPSGTSLGVAEATVQYGGQPFFMGTYPLAAQNDKLVTGDIYYSSLTNLMGYPSDFGLFYEFEDFSSGFFGITISVTAGKFLAVGQSYPLNPTNNISGTDVFAIQGAIITQAPPVKSGVLKINSEIPSPAGNGSYIGYSVNLLCTNGQSIVANGVVLQHS
ncbi:MAG TPA: hypothetical protein VGL56_02725 [Fimbriimonadaceae bacterium]|jgi:hypothetical protein